MSIQPSASEDVQQFDRRSSGYERSFRQGLFFDRVHRATLDLIPQEANLQDILDIGCGTGRLLRKAAQRWPQANLIGVDPAEGMIAVARQQIPLGTFYINPAESLPVPDASVDLVLSTASFHHWADQAEGVRQVARALRAGGYFCLADIVPPYGLANIYRHGRPVDEAGRQALFEQAGLRLEVHRRRLGRFLLLTLGRKIALA